LSRTDCRTAGFGKLITHSQDNRAVPLFLLTVDEKLRLNTVLSTVGNAKSGAVVPEVVAGDVEAGCADVEGTGEEDHKAVIAELLAEAVGAGDSEAKEVEAGVQLTVGLQDAATPST
jgi:hypothetical protein